MQAIMVVSIAVVVWVSVLVVVIALCKAAQAADRAAPRELRRIHALVELTNR